MAKEHLSGQTRLKQKIYSDAVSYFRQKPDIFIIQVLGIKLNVYQRLMVRAFFKYDYCMFITSRGLGKTFISTLCLITWCLLYPNQHAGVIAPSFRQAKLILQEKYEGELKRMSPFLAAEEKDFKCNNAIAKLSFYNGSSIECFPVGVGSGTNAAAKIRGARLTACLVDECVYVPEDIIEGVLIPMLIVQSGYSVDKRGGVGISNKLLMVSSAGYRFNHIYQRYCEWTKEMIKPDNKKFFTLTLPWTIGVAVGLFSEDFIMQQKATMSTEKFQQEYEGIFPKITDGSWVSYTDLQQCSDLYKIETSGVKDYEYIMSLDVARVEGGDNTILNVYKLHWFKDHVECDFVYTVSMNGKTFEYQNKQVRKVLKKFPNTFRIFMDVMGVGKGLADEMAKPFYDEEDDKWMPPIIDMNNEEQVSSIPDGVQLVYGIKASAEVNHNMGMAVKTFTQKRWLHMYNMAADEQRKIDLSSDEERLLLETEETKMEILNIQNKPISNSVYIKFFSKSKRKDRWSAMCLGLYGAQTIAKERLRKDHGMEFMVGVSARR